MQKNIPKLLFSTNEENEVVLEELIEANIECHFCGPLSGNRKPELLFNSRRFYGKDEIQIFIRGWVNGQIKENLI